MYPACLCGHGPLAPRGIAGSGSNHSGALALRADNRRSVPILVLTICRRSSFCSLRLKSLTLCGF